MEPLISIDQLDAGPVTSLDLNSNHGFGPIPEKRKKRAALLSAALSFVIMVVLLGGFTQPKSKLYVANTSSTVDKAFLFSHLLTSHLPTSQLPTNVHTYMTEIQ
jgi:hypothetical protein